MSTETHGQIANDFWSICNLLRGTGKCNPDEALAA